MKQLLFLLLFPCLCVAQYPGNGNQKITLGEQTSADGLVYRGLASDTTRKPSVDTMAFILLDTNTNIIWQYKKAVNNAWTRVGGSISSGVTGVLPVANGGTNTSTAFTAGSVVFAGASGTYTQDNSGLYYNSTNKSLSIGKKNDDNNFVLDLENSTSSNAILRIRSLNATASTRLRVQNDSTQFVDFILYGKNTATTYAGYNLKDVAMFNAGNADVLIGANSSRDLVFITNQSNRALVKDDGEFLIGYTKTQDQGAYKLQVNGQIFATNATIATSDEKFKENITPLNKGLEIVNKLKPVTFNFISDTENNFSQYEEVGFIAQDVDRALSTEAFAKSIVKAADDSEPTSTMGLATQNLIPILVKAIQEQQALIKALEQRIINLENK